MIAARVHQFIELRFGVQDVDEVIPPPFVLKLRGHFIEHADSRREACEYGELRKNAAGESMHCGNCGEVCVADRLLGSLAMCGVVSERLLFEFDADAGLQFTCGRLGEGDRCDCRQRNIAVKNGIDNAGDQLRGLAGSRPGLNEECLLEPVPADEVAGVLVTQHPHHQHSPTCSTGSTAGGLSATRTASSGASALAISWSPRSRTHTLSKSQ